MMSTTQRGFTLIELLVVIAIIGILAAVVLASLDDARQEARIASAATQLKSIHTAMEMLYNDTGLYPHQQQRYCPPIAGADNEVDLSLTSSGLVGNNGDFSNWDGPYISDVTDPWGTPYFFDQDYHCTAGARGCGGIADAGENTSAIVSCGPDQDDTGPGSACAYNDDNIVHLLCRN